MISIVAKTCSIKCIILATFLLSLYVVVNCLLSLQVLEKWRNIETPPKDTPATPRRNKNVAVFENKPHCQILNFEKLALLPFTREYTAEGETVLPNLNLAFLSRKQDGTLSLHLNEEETKKIKMSIKCCYKGFNWSNFQTISSVVDNCVNLNTSSVDNIQDDFLYIKCYSWVAQVYQDVLATFLSPKSSSRFNPASSKANVLVLGIDSFSLTHELPLTKKLLEKTYKLKPLGGFMKISDIPGENFIPLLTGKTSQQVAKDCEHRYLFDSSCAKFVWEQFQKENYVTALAVDSKYLNDIEELVFHQKPTDFNFQPYFDVLDHILQLDSTLTKRTAKIMSMKRLLELALDFLTRPKLKSEPKFGIFWSSAFLKSAENPAVIDAIISNILAKILALKNTYVIVEFSNYDLLKTGNMSRISYRQWHQDRHPLVYLKPPQNFSTMFHHSYHDLLLNFDKLSNNLDLHMTLQDILLRITLEKDFPQNVNLIEGSSKSRSLFSPISKMRTCAEIKTEQNLCICKARTRHRKDQYFVEYISEGVVHYLNNERILQGVSRLCQNVELSKVLLVSETHLPTPLNVKDAHAKDSKVKHMFLIFETTPKAIFEATVELVYHGRNFHQFKTYRIANVQRVDSRCRKHVEISNICVCYGRTVFDNFLLGVIFFFVFIYVAYVIRYVTCKHRSTF